MKKITEIIREAAWMAACVAQAAWLALAGKKEIAAEEAEIEAEEAELAAGGAK